MDHIKEGAKMASKITNFDDLNSELDKIRDILEELKWEIKEISEEINNGIRKTRS
jgi:hypothetical protein